MRVLFDHCVPAPLIRYLSPNEVTEAVDLAWHQLSDRDLLSLAERDGYEVFVTADKNLLAQQNMKNRRIAVVVLETSSWNIVRRYVRRIAFAVRTAKPDSITWISMPKF